MWVPLYQLIMRPCENLGLPYFNCYYAYMLHNAKLNSV